MISSEAKHPNCMYMWMNWIIEPKVNAEVAEWFGEAPAQSLACEHDQESELLQRIPRRRTGLLEARLLLGDPAGRMRQRRKRLHGLQRMGPGLDGDQGLSRGGRSPMASETRQLAEEVGGPQARRPLPRPPPPAGRGTAGRPGRLAGGRLPGLAGGPAGQRLLVGRPAERRGVKGFTLENFDTLLDEPVYRDDRLADGPDRRPGHGHRRAARACRSPSSWRRSRSRRGKALLVVAVLLPLWSSYLVKVYAWRTMPQRGRGAQLGPAPARAARPRLRQHRRLAGDELHLAART